MSANRCTQLGSIRIVHAQLVAAQISESRWLAILGCHLEAMAGVPRACQIPCRTEGHEHMPRLEDEQSFEITENAPSDGGAASAAAPNGKLIGRAQAARLLGVSKSTLRRMEGEALTPVVGPKNVRLFHEEQIQSMVVTRRSEIRASTRVTGEIAATVFELFDESMHPVDVVKRLRLEPDLIEGLYQRWC
jgi:hypothetical protein